MQITHIIMGPNEAFSLSKSANCAFIDANWYLPTEDADGFAEFQKCRIKGAQFFDIDKCCDSESPLPHSLPTAQAFQNTMRALSVNNGDNVIVYDRIGYFSAPRLYWMLRYFGHAKAAVLDGGLKAWQRVGLPTESGGGAGARGARGAGAGDFTAQANRDKSIGADEIAARLGGDLRLIDARPAARFSGQAAEPRPGLRGGHIPGAVNIPYDSLFDKASGQFKDAAELRRIMGGALPSDKGCEVVCSCGSGITACTVALALEILGYENVRLYDGSWAEWGDEKSGFPIA